VRLGERIKLPFLIWVVLISTFIACVGGASFLGYNISGFAWVIPFCVSLFAFFPVRRRIRFPAGIWLPWVALVLIYLSIADAPNALQRSVMMLCPLVVGAAVSNLKTGEKELRSFDRTLRILAVALWGVVIVKTGIYLTGQLPETSGLAAEVMTASLLASYFVATHILWRRKDIWWWAGLAAIPVVAMTRTGMAVIGLTYPMAFAPLAPARRAMLVVLVAVIGVGIFSTERVQQKMFFSGQGTLGDIGLGNPDFRSTGRSTMWDVMLPEIKKEPIFGHGANATEPLVRFLTGGLVHPHNDWLRLLYDYGYLGTLIFIGCLVAQVWHALVRAKSSSGAKKALLYAGASSFLVLILFMFTDNIILYAAFFGNLHFTMLGLAYGALSTEHTSASAPRLR
jgi:O-antigen ligase